MTTNMPIGRACLIMIAVLLLLSGVPHKGPYRDGGQCTMQQHQE